MAPKEEQKHTDLLPFTEYAERQPDKEGLYMWRVKSRYYDHVLQFKAKMRERGAGGARVLSFEGDHWDGWRVTTPEGLQWREIVEGDDNVIIEGLDAIGCPSCGKKPIIETEDGFICALPFQQKAVSIRHCYTKVRSDDWEKAFAAWNTRKADCHEELVEMQEMVAEQLNENSGYWYSCSGCHESGEYGSEQGYPFSDVFKCHPGSGCHECGGIGVKWDNTDYDAVAQKMPLASNRDNSAVDKFVIAMKKKLKIKREEGRQGWEDECEISDGSLIEMLQENLEEFDFVDVGNLAMMLWNRARATNHQASAI